MLYFLDVIVFISMIFLSYVGKPFIFIYDEAKEFVSENVWNVNDSLSSDIVWIILEKMSDWSVLSISTIVVFLGIIYLIYSCIVDLVSEIGWTSFFGNPYIDVVLSIVVLSCLYIISTNVPSLSASNWYDFSGRSTILTVTTYTLIGSFILSMVNTVICNIKGEMPVIFSILAILIKSFILLCGPAIIAWIVLLIIILIVIALVVGISKADAQARWDFVKKFGRKPDDNEAFAFMMAKEMAKDKKD